MDKKDAKRVRLTDKMVLVGLGLAAIYWFLDTFLFIFMSWDVQLFHGFFGFKLSDIWARIIVCCLFVIFGSHAQYTINTRKIIEETLRKREERYRTIIENTEDGYFETNLDGKLLFFNDALCTISGYSREDLVEMLTLQSLIRDGDHTVKDYFDRLRTAGTGFGSVEWTLNRKDGQNRHVESSISLISDSKGQPTGFRGFLRDVTQRKRDEALQQEKLAAEAASKSKSEFLANMSHEIRTPLNSIIGLVELLMDTKLSADQKEDLSVVSSAAKALLALINDILDFSKIEAGKLALESTCFSLREFLGQSLRIMISKAQEKNIELAFRVREDVPERVFGDPDRFRQIILNLVGNAIKFTEDGEVIVEVTREKLSGEAMVLHFSVRDTGIGIPEDKQDRIFRTFEQADGSTSRRFGGTGLGLAVSSQLVELMGGRIWVESEFGKGSTFHFTARFPISEDEECKIKTFMGDKLHGLRALVVDDNATSRDIISEILKCGGMIPEAAEGTEAAQQRLESGGGVRLAVIDADMPAQGGIDLARWLNDHEGLNVKTVMMLTPADVGNRSLIQDLGVKAFLNKPVSPPELFKAAMVALGEMAPEPEKASRSSEQGNGEPGRSLRILVAEDTPFNQKYIKRLLGRWGHTSVIAENGIRALEVLDKDTFDLILMDVQMPEMDGFEATQAIRRKEAKGGGHIPIIAMTAHAMKGDRERCISAGMDDYVSKPISVEMLLEAIQKLLDMKEGPLIEAEKTPEAVDGGEKPPPFDKDALLNAFDNDWEFLSETVDMLLEDYPPMLGEIRNAITGREASVLRRTAHALKGMVGNFQAKTAAEAARILEEKGKNGDFEDAGPAYDTLADEMDRLERNMVEMIEKEKP